MEVTALFHPVIDGYFLVAEPAVIYDQGKQNDVPELTGMNLDERSSADDYGKIPIRRPPSSENSSGSPRPRSACDPR